MAEQQPNNITVDQATVGLNTDTIITQLRPGHMLYALNAIVESFDGNSVTYQNEQGNTICITFPAGFQVIGLANIQQINKIFFWIVNPTTGDCEIGYNIDSNCVYNTLISSKCLSFSTASPIREVVVKTTNCSTQIYWTDGYNPRRYIDLDNLPWVDTPNPDNAFKPLQQVGVVDCNKLLVQPNFSIPEIQPTEVHVGGELVMGTYQFAVQYSNILGEGYTSYYNVTNPLGIYETEVSTSNNLPTSKSIDLSITNLDTTGLYDYFNVAVVKTINNITSVDLVGTFPIVGTSYNYTYTGTEKSTIQLTIADIFETYPYYSTAEGVFQVDNVLGWYGLSSEEDINFQPVWSKVKLQWETYKIPYNNFEGYNNGLNTSLYRGYMRDEVYAFEGRFIFKNGMKTKSFHIPGRAVRPEDLLPLIPEDNLDSASILQSPCDTPEPKKKWEVYNTATLIDYTDEYKANNKTVTKITKVPRGGVNVQGTIDFKCNASGCQQGEVTMDFKFLSATPSGGYVIELGYLNTGPDGYLAAKGYDIFTIPTGAVPNSYYSYPNKPFVISIPGGVTSYSVPINGFDPYSVWPCTNCPPAITITHIYVKVDCNKANFSISNPSITISNVEDDCGTIDVIQEEDCYVGPYQYGDMAYWESTDTYPNNPLIWGDLSNTPIRHHKFPDSLITHIHDNNSYGDPAYVHSIYPIGVRVDIGSIYTALKESGIDQSIIDQIAGFEIARGNRASNKSVVAKGIFNNVGKYTRVPLADEDVSDTQTYYFPNYPYNDLRGDPYFTNTLLENHSGYRPDQSINGFGTPDSNSRFCFHSPDTHFYQPTSIDSGMIKMETVEYGESYGHFVNVLRNAEYQFLTKDSIYIAIGNAIAASINGEAGIQGISEVFKVDPNPGNAMPTYQATLDILRKALPYTNFGYSFNSYGLYNKYFAIPNGGNKQRAVNFGTYLIDGYNRIESGNIINNYNRESSVYVNTENTLPFPDTYDLSIPVDTSRYTISSLFNSNAGSDFMSLFLSDQAGTVPDSTILSGIQNSSFSGPSIFSFTVANQTFIPSVGATYNYTDSSGNIKGSLQLLEVDVSDCVNPDGSPATGKCGTYTMIQTSGVGTDILNTLTQVSSGVDSFGNPVVYYLSTTGNKLIATSSGAISLNVTNVSSIAYVDYASTHPSELTKLTSDIRTIYSNVKTISDINGLNISNPSTLQDFESVAAYTAFEKSYTAYISSSTTSKAPEAIRKTNISSFYGSIKRQLLNQWGQIYSYETISTGYYSPLYQADGTPFTIIPTVFGGDIFINRFALKTKLPIFQQNTVDDADGTNIEYDKIANFTYPMFWHSSRAVNPKIDLTNDINNLRRVVRSFGNVFSGGLPTLIASYKMMLDLVTQIWSNLGTPNTNFDNFSVNGIYEQGLMYLFVYGIPYFFVESEVNVDYRQATNSKEGDFYPHVSSAIPDEWVQEVNVSIANDNTYNYNQSYSKQNKEDYFAHLREDYDPNKPCLTKFPNRAIWSDQSTLEETKNNWLVYRPASYHDFPKSYGGLTAIDTIENRETLVRFENKSQIYNALVTVNTSTPLAAYLGTDTLFSQQPIDLSETDIGYAGSQHKFILRTEFGHIFVDAVRGQVILLQGSKVNDITTNGMDKWFSQYLPFNINKYFPDVDIDNHFTGVGLHGVYDMLYQRLIITKLDYIPLSPAISYQNGKFYFDPCYNPNISDTPTGAQANVLCNQPLIEIQLTDPKYFCNKSWSISYSFKTGSWISYHSYQPNFYVPFANYFQSGLNQVNAATLWNHNKTFSVFNNFYGNQYPYILEYPLVFQGAEDQILQAVKDYCTSRKYVDFNNYYNTNSYFNKSIIYNDYQCTGVLNLVAKPQNDLSAYLKYPKFNTDSKDILFTKTDNLYQYNTFWNIGKDGQPYFTNSCDLRDTDKELIQANMDYSTRSYKKDTIRGKNARVRHILDNMSDTRLMSQFTLFPTQTSYK